MKPTEVEEGQTQDTGLQHSAQFQDITEAPLISKGSNQKYMRNQGHRNKGINIPKILLSTTNRICFDDDLLQATLI